jgi:hypothetical protein
LLFWQKSKSELANGVGESEGLTGFDGAAYAFVGCVDGDSEGNGNSVGEIVGIVANGKAVGAGNFVGVEDGAQRSIYFFYNNTHVSNQCFDLSHYFMP